MAAALTPSGGWLRGTPTGTPVLEGLGLPHGERASAAAQNHVQVTRQGQHAPPRRGQQGDSFLSFHQGLRWTQAGGHGDLVPVPEHTASPGAHCDVLHCGTQGGNRSLWGSGSVSPQKSIQSKEGLMLDRLDDEQMSFL